MVLSEDDPIAFECLISSIYQNISTPFPNRELPISKDFSEAQQACRQFSKKVWYPSFVLAHKYCMHDLENNLMDEIRFHHMQCTILPDIDDVEYIYQNTADTGKLRQYCIASLHSNCTQV